LADPAPAEALFRFVIVVVFPELSSFFEKQFLDHPSRSRSVGDLEHWPVVLNVLLYDKTLQKHLRNLPQPCW
jgi:hypothetical protein